MAILERKSVWQTNIKFRRDLLSKKSTLQIAALPYFNSSLCDSPPCLWICGSLQIDLAIFIGRIEEPSLIVKVAILLFSVGHLWESDFLGVFILKPVPGVLNRWVGNPRLVRRRRVSPSRGPADRVSGPPPPSPASSLPTTFPNPWHCLSFLWSRTRCCPFKRPTRRRRRHLHHRHGRQRPTYSIINSIHMDSCVSCLRSRGWGGLHIEDSHFLSRLRQADWTSKSADEAVFPPHHQPESPCSLHQGGVCKLRQASN